MRSSNNRLHRIANNPGNRRALVLNGGEIMKQKKATTTRHIGAAGELLVQYKLIKEGVDSARMTSDAG